MCRDEEGEGEKMKTAKFQYKCRLCGAIEENPCTSEDNAWITLISLLHGHDISQLKFVGMTPKMQTTHLCKEGSHGVADLIGYKVYDE